MLSRAVERASARFTFCSARNIRDAHEASRARPVP
jgi:hypothetical protein